MTFDTSRIDYLISRSSAAQARITIVGLGSGGAAVLQSLAMCGIRRWTLYDPDVLEASNLVKHPALRRDLGKPKVSVMAEWLSDRNPAVEVEVHQEDVFDSSNFDESVLSSDVVICAVDNRAARTFINERCVTAQRPCITGSVMRTGVGGEIYSYIPGVTGCHTCLERYCDLNHRNLDDLVALTPEENSRHYGLDEVDFAASGLSTDIATIASIHASTTLSLLLGGSNQYIEAPRFNWLIVGLRTLPGAFDVPYSISRLLLGPRSDCPLSCSEQAPVAHELEYSADI